MRWRIRATSEVQLCWCGDNMQFISRENRPAREVGATRNLRGAAMLSCGDNMQFISRENRSAHEVGAYAQLSGSGFDVEDKR